VKGFDPANYMDRRTVRRSSRCTQLAFGAAQEAMTDAGLDAGGINAVRFGISIGTGVGSLDSD